MVLYFLGSSVTYGSATNGHSFVEEIASSTDWECVKEAVSGTALAVRENDGDLSYVARLKKLDANRGVSKLIVQLSTNDAAQNVPLGKISDDGNYDIKTVIGAIEYIVVHAKKFWNCEVVFYTNPYFENANYKKMVTALYEVQKKLGIGVIDFYSMQLEEQTLSSYMSDAIHPNEKGYQWMSGVFIDCLKRI